MKVSGGVSGDRLADMSKPPEERGRRARKGKTPRKRKRVPAQFGHGLSPKGRKWAREGEALMRRTEPGRDDC
jgi:hypothetical protein